MIKNKTLHIKIIFKTYLKILKIGEKYFRFSNKLLFHKNQKIVLNFFLKNNFLEPFLKLVAKQAFGFDSFFFLFC